MWMAKNAKQIAFNSYYLCIKIRIGRNNIDVCIGVEISKMEKSRNFQARTIFSLMFVYFHCIVVLALLFYYSSVLCYCCRCYCCCVCCICSARFLRSIFQLCTLISSWFHMIWIYDKKSVYEININKDSLKWVRNREMEKKLRFKMENKSKRMANRDKTNRQ